LNNGNKKKREELGLDTDGYCDTRMITDWKLDFMAKALLEHLWTERRKSVLIAIDLIKCYYKEEKEIGKQSDVVVVQARLDKANTRLTNLIAMRADGEITKDEYQVMRTPIDTEIQELQKVLENIPTDNDNLKGFDLDSIISTLNSLVDFSGSTISHDVINQFVYLVTPTSDTTFEWYVNLNGKPNVKATFTAEGRKKNCLIRLEEIERISSLHRKENESNAQLIKNPCLLTYLHRLLLQINNLL
jgi:recombinase-like protein